ncbi:Transposase (plasmid) [Planktothrix agardhii]|jgi:putative transposase|uniref:Transposase n=3 Tax=Bacteria TaxID=2 RepID=A0A1J1JPU7_PLAAG|nr:transposase [Planktothrix agardhii]MCF3627477.1 transposase [Planktothrix agardhii 1801]CAD5929495.1 Transposase [Planktothrix agardhii]CAD5983641.1 Transposase [Planktothrix agardhii]CUM62348.1 transposase [Planktothrix agardhii]
MSNYGCQQVLIKAEKNLSAILEFVCGESAKLSNCGTYYARQLYFKTGKIPSKFDLHKLFKSNNHFQALYSHVAQQCLTTVAESFKSYLGLVKAVRKGAIEQRPRLPGYRKNGLALVTFPRADVKLKDSLLRFPLGSKVKVWFGLDAFYLPMPSNLKYEDIREIRILPRNHCFYAEFVYKMPSISQLSIVNKENVLGIDPGINNWLTCVSNVGTSLIIDGKHLKSMNQNYNKRISTLKENKPQGFWSKQLAHITEKRNRQVKDGVNKAARQVIRHCLENQIGTVVFGWNKGQKQDINLGAKTNQKFVQIPTARLKDRIAELCEQYGIIFVETEESYTSKSSFLDGDMLPTFGAKPEGWQPSGNRVKRGLYRTAQGYKLNADCNGAANIIKKVAMKLGLDLSGISRVSLSAPLKVRLWNLQESPSL